MSSNIHLGNGILSISAQQLLHILADGKYHSGSELGKALDVSRAAIWKLIHRVEQQYGISIFAVKGKGYRLQHPMELLSEEKIRSCLSSRSLEQLNKFELFFDIESTNQYLGIKSFEGAASGYIVVAEQQTRGQGRRGRQWVSPFGCNLYLSLLWRFQAGPAQLGCLGLFVAVAIVRALKSMGINGVGIKWPNDIIYKGRKLAGILLEMRGEASGPSAVVVGIGINLNQPVAGKNLDAISVIDQPWVTLEEIAGDKVSRNEVTANIINALFDVLPWVIEQRELLLKEWQQMDVLYDEEVEVHFSDKTLQGKANGINQDGALKVISDGKEITCHSGEVSIRRYA